jgi:excinuclease UvrABC ATPase subunit
VYDITFEGLIKSVARRYRETSAESTKAEYETFMTITPCEVCGGKRLKPTALAVTVGDKKSESRIRVKLDTENYRARRKETLENLAKNIAFKVKRSKRSFALEPMNPYERRIIHATLQNDKYVATRSEGEEPYRKVIVYLKKK